MDSLLREAFKAPAHPPTWEADLLKALGYVKLPFPPCQEIMQTLKPLMGELYLKAPDATTTPWPEQDHFSGESGKDSEVAGKTPHPRFQLKLNARDEVILIEGDNSPIILGQIDMVREQLLQFMKLQSNDRFPAEDRAA